MNNNNNFWNIFKRLFFKKWDLPQLNSKILLSRKNTRWNRTSIANRANLTLCDLLCLKNKLTNGLWTHNNVSWPEKKCLLLHLSNLELILMNWCPQVKNSLHHPLLNGKVSKLKNYKKIKLWFLVLLGRLKLISHLQAKLKTNRNCQMKNNKYHWFTLKSLKTLIHHLENPTILAHMLSRFHNNLLCANRLFQIL